MSYTCCTSANFLSSPWDKSVHVLYHMLPHLKKLKKKKKKKKKPDPRFVNSQIFFFSAAHYYLIYLGVHVAISHLGYLGVPLVAFVTTCSHISSLAASVALV